MISSLRSGRQTIRGGLSCITQSPVSRLRNLNFVMIPALKCRAILKRRLRRLVGSPRRMAK